MNSDLMTDRVSCADGAGTHPADDTEIETGLSSSAESAACTFQERRCELFEGGLGI